MNRRGGGRGRGKDHQEEEGDHQWQGSKQEGEIPAVRPVSLGSNSTWSHLQAKKGEDDGEIGVSIVLQQHVSLTFSLKYLQNFAKSAPLAEKVTLNMSNEVPLLVAFDFEQGHINYYLAPKVSARW
jgi:proliferating cell nuclear antigen